MVSPSSSSSQPYERPSIINVAGFEDLESVLKLVSFKLNFLLKQSVLRYVAVIQSASLEIPDSSSRLLTRRYVTDLSFLVKYATMTYRLYLKRSIRAT